MDTVVVSTYRKLFWFIQVVVACFIIAFVLFMLGPVIESYRSGNIRNLVICLLMIAVPVVKYTVSLIKGLVTVFISPDNVEFRYWLTGREVVIDYADIQYISNRRSRSEGPRPSLNTRTCVIGLTDESEYESSDLEFSNYTELKDAVWDYKHMPKKDKQLGVYSS